ncbi:lantibiotic dehydratase [Natronosporangium hydrolyticum]|uniref:Lantibiotic dehydratase n=2 Tax=Natronosporangium hydrolyticum TaxID=2811111 RepID=A0A895YTW6_9ACTN|nr:lantibiotic dehydratase [Natronosporangium hydrolyticum]
MIVRASTDPGDLDRLGIDLDDPAAVATEGRVWLTKLWSRTDVREALSLASPTLAARVEQLLDRDPAVTASADLRRAVLSAAGYLMRWQRRATPFGLFAGVTAAAVGPAAASVGQDHRAVVRVDADWLTALVDQLEQHPPLLQRLTVVADTAGMVRDGRFVVAGRADASAGTPGPLREVSVRYTRPVQAVLAAAAAPVRVESLVPRVAAAFPTTPPAKVAALVDALIAQRILLTSLRAPMTAVDGLAHLVEVLRAVDAAELADIAPMLSQLEKIREQLADHNTCPDQRQAAAFRASAAAHMDSLATTAGHVLAADVRLGSHITLPENVVEEAQQAASVLLRLTTKPFGTQAWLDYHARFRVRYGPGALVPVRDLVAGSGLGYPAGYLGGPRTRPTWRALTERDAALLAMIQQAAADQADEIDLSDADVDTLTVGEHTDLVAPQRVELGVVLDAASTGEIDRGRFRLWVTAVPRAYTSMAGRFTYLLDPTDRRRLAATYAAPGGDDVVAVQLSYPPRRPHNENVVRIPRLLPDVVCLSEHHDGDTIRLDDLAVTADAEQMYLIQSSTGRRVVPRIPHALDTSVQSPPLARFLAEVADARSAVFGPFDFGAARTLPHTPRIRYRRTVLAAARWILTAADVATDAGWQAGLESWRRRWRVPARVVLRDGELRLPLELDQRLDRTLLRGRLEKSGRLELQEDVPSQAPGWIGRPAELLIPMTTAAPQPRPVPTTAPPGPVHRPGSSRLLHARLTGDPAHFDDLLVCHLPALVDELSRLGLRRWWAHRHRDHPDGDQHLAIVVDLTTPDRYAPTAAKVATFAAGLHQRGLPADIALVPYAQQPGRYGEGPALAAAELVFAADTQAAIAQIATARACGVPAQALAAASMAQLAAAFAPDPATGYRALLACLPQQTGPLDRSTAALARHLSDPAGGFSRLRGLPGGQRIVEAWHERDAALAAYHHNLTGQRDPSTVLRSLLHGHHRRALDLAPETEKTTGRLARAAALRRLAPSAAQ